jgi:gliding motility-associated-like protein
LKKVIQLYKLKGSNHLLPLLFILALIGSPNQVEASHLMGGSLTYEYISSPTINGVDYIRYHVILKAYRDCKSDNGQGGTTPFDPTIGLGVYKDDANKNFYQTFASDSLIESSVEMPWSDNCTNIDTSKYCIKEGTYHWTIDLPYSSNGYHLQYLRCCRNTMVNIPNLSGQGYYTYIPPSSIKNNSPYFTQTSAPFICTGDTIDFANNTADIDGDSLVYSFETPYAGGDAQNSTPSFPPNLPDPLDEITYSSGYGVGQPFGAAGYSFINTFSGLTRYRIPAVGNYSLAVEVKEYRNGTLVGVVRRDVQLIAINTCSNVSTLKLGDNSNKDLYYEVVEGEQLCFKKTFYDNPKLTISVSAWGDPIDGTGRVSGKTPYASKVQYAGKDSVTAQFCWTPAAGLASSQPYFITMQATDNGCPKKTKLVDIFIKVLPFTAKGQIKGATKACTNKTYTYSVTNRANFKYKWAVNNGTVNAGQNTSSIDVVFSNPGNAEVILEQTNAVGSISPNDTLLVTVVAGPTVKNISGDTVVCEFETNLIYSISGTAGSTYQWYIQNGNITAGSTSNSATVDWGAKGMGQLVIIETNSVGCPSDSMILPIRITKPVTSAIDGTKSVCPHIKDILYLVEQTAGSQYFWVIQGGTQSGGGNNHDIHVDWGTSGQAMVKVREVDVYGCLGDTVYFPVNINWKLEGEKPQGDSIVCAFTQNIHYQVHQTNHSVYSWVVQGGTLKSGNSTNDIIVDWDAPGIGRVIVTEISYDSISNLPCFSDPDTLLIKIAELPQANHINGNFYLCEGDKLYTYQANGNAGSTYIWTLNDTIQTTITDTISFVFPVSGNYTLSFTEITADSCIGVAFDSIIQVHPIPLTSAIIGDSNICYPNFASHTYEVIATDNSIYKWYATQGVITSGQGTANVIVDWSGKNPAAIGVVEVNEFGCKGDSVNYHVFADNTAIVLDMITVGKQNDRAIELYWHLENAPRYTGKIHIYKRAIDTNSPFRLVTSVDSNLTTYTDIRVAVSDSGYEYILKGQDLCGGELSSEPHSSIYLKGKKYNSTDSAYDSWLQWTRYLGWKKGVLNYEVLRKPGEEDYMMYERKYDTSSTYSNGLESYTQCYRIAGYKKSDTLISYSNIICINFDPALWVPNAFSPNADEINDSFQLKGGALKHFEMRIYNRWGSLMFESNTIQKSWDGIFYEKPCLDDIYVYIIKYWGADNVLQTLTGNIHLLR